MGVSFKVSKIGTRYRPKPGLVAEVEDEPAQNAKAEMTTVTQTGISNQSNGFSAPIPPDLEVSFAISLFPPGYHVGKPNEMPKDSKTLHPYDRASENLFSAIEAGWLPGDILDDIPSKYYNGSVICEVKDYRKCRQDQIPAPVIHKVRLKMSLENVVKDVHFMSDDSWTYGDLLEVESRIVKAMQPKLCLDPNPMFDRLCTDPIPTKLNLGLGRKRRSELIVTTSNKSTGKKVCIEKPVPVPDQQETGTVSLLPAGAHPFRQVSGNLSQEAARLGLPPLSSSQPIPNLQQYNNNNIINNNNINTNNNYPDAMLNVKKEYIDSNMDIKKVRQIQQQPIGVDELAHQVRGGPQMGLNHQLQQYAAALAGQSQSQRFPNSDAAGPSFYQNVRFNNPKEEQQQTDLLTQQWQHNNNNININNNSGPKRKTANSPRVPQSPVSSLSSGQKDVKMVANQNATAGGKRKSGGNSVQKVTAQQLNVGSPVSVSNMTAQQQLNVSSPSVATSLAGGSGASDQGSVLERFAKLEAVANKHGLNVRKVKAEPPQLQKKTNTVAAAQELQRQLAASYSSEDFTDTESPMSLSLIGTQAINTYKSRIVHFVRNDRNFQGMVRNQYQLVLMEKPFDGTVGMQHGDVESDSDNPFTSPDCPLSLPNIHYADLLAAQFSTLMEKDGYEKKEDQIRPLPIRMVAPPSQGPLPFSPDSSQSQPAIESKPDISMLPAVTPQQQQPVSVPSNRMLPSGGNNNNNNPIPQQQQGYGQARSQPLDQSQSQALLHQQHMQQNIQQNIPNRSGPMMSASNNLIAQMMNNKNIPLNQQQQLHMLQQHQNQQNQQIPRKVMMGGLGAVPSMGMNPNNMVGLGGPGLSNIMGINNMRNLSPMTNMSQNQMNLSSLAGQLRPPGGLTAAQQANLKLRWQQQQQQRAAMLNAVQTTGNINNINNISNNNAMLGNSSGLNIMSHVMNRGSMGQFQMQHRPMGPPKIQAGGFYMNNNNNNNNNINNNNNGNNNQQQQQQLQLQQQLQQQQLQMQQVGSPLQQVGSPPQQAGSSQSGLTIQQQQQQMGLNAMSPQQMSGSNLPQVSNSGNINGANNNNNNNNNNNGGMPPASPQLSSQTQGSVGN